MYRKNIYGEEEVAVNIVMQLYDYEEIMRVHDMGIAIGAIVETYQDLGRAFAETVDKIAEKFSLSIERAEEEVSEYWKE